MINMTELLAKARQERSEYVRRLVSGFVRRIAAHRARAQLEAMTDRELADIGLTRGDIDNVVVGNDTSVRRKAA